MKIFAHGDADGVCSASLIKLLHPEAEVWFAKPSSLYTYLKEVQPGTPLFILDIAINELYKEEIFKKLAELSKEADVTYVDHHPLPLQVFKSDVPCNFVHQLGMSTSELVFRYFSIPEGYDKIALWGAIGDYCEETDFVREHLSKYDRRAIYMEAGLLSEALSEADFDYKRSVVEALSRGATPVELPGIFDLVVRASQKSKEILEYVRRNVKVEGNLAIVYGLPSFSSGGKAAFNALGLTGVDVGICVLRKGDEMDISMRRRAGVNLNLDLLLRKVALRFGGSGGGHEGAAGARIPVQNFEAFMETLKREISPMLPRNSSLRR
jgi:RecJ-like exonuclease